MERPMCLGAGSRSPTKASQLESLQTGLCFGAVLLPRACASNSELQIGAPSYSEFTCLSHYGPWQAPPPRQSCLRCSLLPPFPFAHSLSSSSSTVRAESAHLEKGKPISQSVLVLTGFQVHIICLLDACSLCQLLLYCSFPQGRWLWICPRCVCFFWRVAFQTAGTTFPNLSRASSPWRHWLKGSTHTPEGHVFCGTSPAGLLQEGSSWWDCRAGIAGWEAHYRALAWATGYATSPEPEREGAWATSMQLWCPRWVIPKSHYEPSQHFPNWGTSLFPKARGMEMLAMGVGGSTAAQFRSSWHTQG